MAGKSSPAQLLIQLLPRCLEKLLRGNLLKSTSLIVCESGAQEDLFCGDEALADRFDVIKSTRYGVAYVNILKVKSRNEE